MSTLKGHPAFDQPAEILYEDRYVWRLACGNKHLTGCDGVVDRPKRTGRPGPDGEIVWTTEPTPTKAPLCMTCGFNAIRGKTA